MHTFKQTAVHILGFIISTIIFWFIPTIIGIILLYKFVPLYGYVNILKLLYILPTISIIPIIGNILVTYGTLVFHTFSILGLIFIPELRSFILLVWIVKMLWDRLIMWIMCKGIIGFIIAFILNILSAIAVYLFI